ncbi:MAG: helix-turn-helix domain-containing protein [Acidimicrobiales bacterium]
MTTHRYRTTDHNIDNDKENSAMQDTDEPMDRSSIQLAYSVPDAAAMIGISRRTCYELMTSGQLRSVKLGRRRLIRHTDLVAFVDALGDEQAA